ncbi:alpha/beta hydrolase [Streptomyces sp. NPDC014894]|uniref:alpha/beta hydrolase n=1 Tax=unclassified Streptomyces TaxID=2593676 RepID=UPI0036FA1C25
MRESTTVRPRGTAAAAEPAGPTVPAPRSGLRAASGAGSGPGAGGAAAGPGRPPTYRPELAALIADIPYLDIADPPAARRLLKELETRWPAPDTGALVITERAVPGPGGAPDVPVRVYTPRTPGPHGALLWFHGGGFVMGDLETEHSQCVRFAADADCVVVGVQYRLAPENPFPAGVEDCYAALEWVAGNTAGLGVDPGRLAVAGCSAGGALAAGVSLLARDRGGPAPVLQVLTYPVIDDRMDTPSARRFQDTPVWSTPQSALMWHHYLGAGHEQRETSPYAAPGRAADLSGLPPAHIVTAEYDPLRDEGIGYGLRLLRAGVPAGINQWAGAFHVFDSFGTPLGERVSADIVAALRAAFDD